MTGAEAKLMTYKINFYHCKHKITNTIKRVVQANVTLISTTTNRNSNNNSIQFKCLRTAKANYRQALKKQIYSDTADVNGH
jgi:hypothetical protein